MKTRTVEVREGEYLGPVDWGYDFEAHGWDRGGAMNPKCLKAAVQRLQALDDGMRKGELWEATTDGGWPRVGWGIVRRVGMWDGWPYWEPTPSILITSWMGGSWNSVFQLRDIRAPSGGGEHG